MSTEFPYLQMNTPERKKLVGKQDKGTRIYRREGSFKESGEWCVTMDEVFEDQFVSPGGVGMFVPVRRAAVHKRMKEGRVTALCFYVVHDEKRSLAICERPGDALRVYSSFGVQGVGKGNRGEKRDTWR